MRLGSLDLGDKTPLILAPLAGYSDLVFRAVCRRFGADLTVSEMVSADGMVLASPRSKGYKKTVAYLDAAAEDHPFAAQLFGKDPQLLAKACRMAAVIRQVEVIDLNAGCPVRKVVNSGHGVALMRDPELLRRILAAMRAATDLPLMVKLRAGAETVNVLECARAAEQAGVDAVAVHPRTRAQQFTGRADWSLIAAVKAAVAVPVIGNGDVVTGADAVAMVEQTGCDAVMIGRGAVGRPWLFAQARAALDGKTIPPEPVAAEKLRVLQLHLDLMVAAKGEEKAAREIRKFALRLVWGVRGATVTRREIATAPNTTTLMAAVRRVFAAAGEEGEDE